MDANGNIVDRLDKDNGHFRSWIGAGLTSDGQFIYAGGAEHFLGSTEPPGYYGCSVVKGTELEFVIMVIAVSCVKLLSAHNSTQHTSRKHKV
jgi:hypothetical protein